MASKDKQRVMVTDANFGDLLIEGLREAVAVSRGKQEPARRETRAVPPGQDGSRS